MNSDQKLDKILEELTAVKITQAQHSLLHEKNTEDLAEHIRRTNALESKLEPVEKHVTRVETALKIAGIIGAVILGLNQLGLLKF